MSTDDELEKIKQQMLKRMMTHTPTKPKILRNEQINELTDANFQQALSEADKPVLVDFLGGVVRPMQDDGPGNPPASGRVRRQGVHGESERGPKPGYGCTVPRHEHP